MRATSFHHDRARTQRPGKLRILLLGVGLVACWILLGDLPSLQPLPVAEAIRLTQEQGYVVDKPLWSPGKFSPARTALGLLATSWVPLLSGCHSERLEHKHTCASLTCSHRKPALSQNSVMADLSTAL